VWADVAYLGGEPIAGVAHFVVARHVDSSFYFCQDPRHQALQGLTLLVIEGLRRAKQQGFDWFDFGTSSVGGVARPHIFRFKEAFSRSGQLRETFAWSAAT
jgi:GNAT acetyltransferase-like protein